MSFTDSAIPGKDRQISGKPYEQATADLNTLVKDSLKKMQSRFPATDIIVRCESLPSVRGNREELAHLFENMLGMIFHSSPRGSKLFLYVGCEMQNGGDDPASWRTYLIKFHTNITVDEAWKKQNEALLGQCREIVLQHQGVFLVNEICNTGCLFSVAVAGKHH